jgi:hypothetical protein
VEVGFEPTEPLSSHAFKARPFGRFGTPPLSIIPLGSTSGGAGRPARLRTVAKFPAEASPSPVYGAGLLIPLGGNPLASSNLAASAPQPTESNLVGLGNKIAPLAQWIRVHRYGR